MELNKALKMFGITALKPFQQDVLDCLMGRRDAMCIVPTGSGKSLIFQLMALLMEKLVIVIEPHLALELDQVKKLKELNIPAAYINSMTSRRIQQIPMMFILFSPPRIPRQ